MDSLCRSDSLCHTIHPHLPFSLIQYLPVGFPRSLAVLSALVITTLHFRSRSFNMNFFNQGRSAADAGPEIQLHQSSSNERPGKFPDLSKFMVIDKGYQLKYSPGTQAPVDPGHIVYIKDTSREDSRINDRVM